MSSRVLGIVDTKVRAKKKKKRYTDVIRHSGQVILLCDDITHHAQHHSPPKNADHKTIFNLLEEAGRAPEPKHS